jgi:hypothetical protein
MYDFYDRASEKFFECCFFSEDYPFKRNKRKTKSLLGAPTTPFFLIARLRLVDFLVRMCLLNAFWKVISPVPVTLKRFLALEFVLTLGIYNLLRLLPAGVPNGRKLVEPCGKWSAKLSEINRFTS